MAPPATIRLRALPSAAYRGNRFWALTASPWRVSSTDPA